MDAIPAMPVSPAPVTEAASNPRDAKGCDTDARGFGDQLKHEIAARSTDAKDAPADEAAATDATDATDATSDDKAAKDAAVADAPVALDPAVAALLGDTGVQPPIAVALPVQPAIQQTAAAETAAGTETAAEIDAIADARPAGVPRAPVDGRVEQRAAERSAKGSAERAGIDRGNAERSTIERSALEQAANERGAFERGSAERSAFERVPPEPREFRPLREGDERAAGSHGKNGIETAASLMNGFTVDRGATALDAPAPVAAAASTLDSLSAATLGAKWGQPLTAAGADAAPQPATARIDTPLGSTGWGDAFQQKVVWMVDRQLERAELHVNPPHLGPVDVMLNLTGDGAQIAFASPHAAVRDAIEASLQDLRNALDQKGVSLGQATVGADSGAAREQFAEQAREAARNAQNGRSGAPGPIALETPSPARTALLRRGLVDTFA